MASKMMIFLNFKSQKYSYFTRRSVIRVRLNPMKPSLRIWRKPTMRMRHWNLSFRVTTSTTSHAESMIKHSLPCVPPLISMLVTSKRLTWGTTRSLTLVQRLLVIWFANLADCWVLTFKVTKLRVKVLNTWLSHWRNAQTCNCSTWIWTRSRPVVQWWSLNCSSLTTSYCLWI